MSEQPLKPSPAATAGGVVRVGAAEFFVRKLSVTREQALWDHLSAEAKKAFGDGGFLERGAKALDWLRKSGRTAEWQAAVGRLAELEGTGAAPAGAAVDEFRRSPDGVALELWHRTRADHPDATREQFRAAVNESNALDVFLNLLDCLTDHKSQP